MINFYSEVASNLRAKNYTETEIRSVLDEVHAHVAASGQSPEAISGLLLSTPPTLKKRLRPVLSPPNLSCVYGLVFVLAAVYFFARIIWPAVDRGASVGLWGTIGALVVVTVGSWLLSYRMPAKRDGESGGTHED